MSSMSAASSEGQEKHDEARVTNKEETRESDSHKETAEGSEGGGEST
jgi:hypothetical protein